MMMVSSSTTTAAFAMTSDEAAEVFRSMKVETSSKTPYSDATQVSSKLKEGIVFVGRAALSLPICQRSRVESAP